MRELGAGGGSADDVGTGAGSVVAGAELSDDRGLGSDSYVRTGMVQESIDGGTNVVLARPWMVVLLSSLRFAHEFRFGAVAQSCFPSVSARTGDFRFL